MIKTFNQWFKDEGLMRLYNKSRINTLTMRGFRRLNEASDGWYNHQNCTPREVANELAIEYGDQDVYEYIYMTKKPFVYLYRRRKDWYKNGSNML